MGRLTVADAERMCTKAELGVVMGSRPDAIEKLSADQLKKNVALRAAAARQVARLSMEQRRETQRLQNARVTDKNARSGEKAALFAHVLKRYEDQLKQVEAAGAAGGMTLAKPAKEARRSSAGRHRSKRAMVRDELEGRSQRAECRQQGESEEEKGRKEKRPRAGGNRRAEEEGCEEKSRRQESGARRRSRRRPPK